jgi:hypothetical protein
MKTLHAINFHAEMSDKLKDFIKSKNIPMHTKGVNFGNCCLINIPDGLMQDLRDAFDIG